MNTAVEFLREYFHGSKGNIFLGAVRNAGSKLGSGHIGEIATRRPEAVAKFVATYDKPENECAIYYVTATLKNGATKRPEAADCAQFVSLFADIDDGNHELDRAAILGLLEALPCPPTYVVDSGHGLQPVWLFDKPTEDAERVIAARKKLHAILASDSVHDAPRYMRLPGSHNSKRGGWKPVTVVSNHAGLRYTVEALEAWLAAAQVVVSRKPKPKNGAAGKPFVAPPSSGKGTDPKRGAAWARVALEESARELAGVSEEGHNTLLAKAVRMGTMIARGWIDTLEVRRVLLAAAEACGLIKARGRPHFESTFADGVAHGLTMPHADLPDDGTVPPRSRTQAAPDPAATTPRGETGVALTDFHAYAPMHNFIYVPSGEFWPASSVNARLPNMPVLDEAGGPIKDKSMTAATWLDQNRSVEQMTWCPGLPTLISDRLISDGGWIEHKGVTCYNTYRPPTIKRGDAKAAGPWIAHAEKVFSEDARHIINWLAHRVQRPQEKINHALVLGGHQGIGKDTLLEPVKLAVGPWNFLETSPKQMLGRFNAFVKSVILRVSEARDLGDVDRYAFYDHLKSYTAAPPDVLRVDEKHLREHNVLNCVGLIITSNHKTDGIYLPADDRRHFVAWSELLQKDLEAGYFKKLYDWYENGGIQHVAAYLAELDISRFDPKAPPPKTPAFWAIVAANHAPEDAELADVLDSLGSPPAVTLAQIQNAAQGDFGVWIKDRKNLRQIPHRLEDTGYVPVRHEHAKDGLWRIHDRRQAVYARAELTIRDRLAAASRLAGSGA
jgi:hypothetical protein